MREEEGASVQPAMLRTQSPRPRPTRCQTSNPAATAFTPTISPPLHHLCPPSLTCAPTPSIALSRLMCGGNLESSCRELHCQRGGGKRITAAMFTGAHVTHIIQRGYYRS